jgi:energy-coupling factor transporter ATP-binding protein EcfA2
VISAIISRRHCIILHMQTKALHAMPARVALRATHLRKVYGRVTTLDGVSLTVKSGEIVGLLGPNGAGKTTTINTVLGVLAATTGSIEIDGIDISKERARALARTNFAAVYAALPGNLTVVENLRFFGLLYSIDSLGRDRDVASGHERLPPEFLCHGTSLGRLSYRAVRVRHYARHSRERDGSALGSGVRVACVAAAGASIALCGCVLSARRIAAVDAMGVACAAAVVCVEGMRALLADRPFPGTLLLQGSLLAAAELLLAAYFYGRVYARAVRTGLLARYSAESSS